MDTDSKLSSEKDTDKVKKIRLFDSDDSDTDPENDQLTINTEFAAKYEKWKSKEELQKLKAKYGSDVSSSSSSEDECLGLDANTDRNWLRVQALLLANDPRIHDKDAKFYDEDEVSEEEEGSDSDSGSSESEEDTSKKKKKYRPTSSHDHGTKNDGALTDSEQEEEEAQRQGLSYHEEQEAIRESLKKAVAESDDEEDTLRHHKKRNEEKEIDKEEYLQFMRGEKEIDDMVTKDKDLAKDLKPLRDHIQDPNLPDDQKLLWNILLNKSYLKSDDEDSEMLEEVVAEELDQDISEDEEPEQDEHASHFCFQEKDQNFMKQYRRKPEESVRMDEKKRAEKRKEIRQRRKMAEEERRRDIRRLRYLMKEELQSRMERIMKECPSGVDFSAEELKGDFNPKAYDKMMQAKFGNMDNEDDEEDNEKPDIKDLDDIISIGSYENFEEEETDFPEDAEAAGGFQPDEEEAGPSGIDRENEADEEENAVTDNRGGRDLSWLSEFNQSSRRSRRKRKRSKLQQAVDSEKPRFADVSEKYQNSETAFEDYLKEYYNLDYKEYGFRYRNVVPNNYGIEASEMLWLPARELNAWMSMKKVVEQKTDEEEMYFKRKYESAKMQKKVPTILPSLAKLQDEQYSYEDIRPSTLRKQKLEQQFVGEDDSDGSEQLNSDQLAEEDVGIRLQSDSQQSGKKKKKQKTDVRESAEEAPPRKKKKKRQSGSGSSQLLNDGVAVAASQTNQGGEGKKKKKGKKKMSALVDLPDNAKSEAEVTEQPTDIHIGEGKKKKKKRKLETENQEDINETPSRKKKKKENQEVERTENTTGEQTKAQKKKKKKKATKEKETSGTFAEKETSNGTGVSSENLNAREMNKEKQKKKKKKKQLSEEGQQQQTVPKSGKKKQKKKKNKESASTKGYVAKDRMQDSRLAAFHIDSRKFKYIKHRIGPSEPDHD